MVWRLDRVGCSIPHLVKLLKEVRECGVGFRSICDNVLEELKYESTSSFICIQKIGAFLGCDRDAIPDYLGPWEWLDTEIEEFCPQCGWRGGVHYNSALGSENCLRCGYPIFLIYSRWREID